MKFENHGTIGNMHGNNFGTAENVAGHVGDVHNHDGEGREPVDQLISAIEGADLDDCDDLLASAQVVGDEVRANGRSAAVTDHLARIAAKASHVAAIAAALEAVRRAVGP